MEIIDGNEYRIFYREVIDNKNKVYTMYNLGKRLEAVKNCPVPDMWKLIKYEEYDFLSGSKIDIDASYDGKYGLLKNLQLTKDNFIRNIVLDNGLVISDSTWDITTDKTEKLLMYNSDSEHLHIYDYLNNDKYIETNQLFNRFLFDHSRILSKMKDNENSTDNGNDFMVKRKIRRK